MLAGQLGRAARAAAAAAVAALAALAAPAAPAMDQEKPHTAVTPWDTLDWRNLTPVMRTYICMSDTPAAWCPEWQAWQSADLIKAEQEERERLAREEAARRAAVPEKAVPDDVWAALLKRIAAAAPTGHDLALIRKRAERDGDPAAYETLGFIYAEGLGVEADYVRAYEYYGQALLAGSSGVKPNMDALWQALAPADRARLREEFSPGS